MFAPDEGRYAQIAQAMLASGDWITPRLNGFKYFEKPPLQYWATALAFMLLGEDEWTARLGPAVAGLLGALALMYAKTRLDGAASGGLVALMLATSLGYFLAGQYITLDMGLTFFLTCALAAFLVAQHAQAARDRTRWMLAAWAAMALAVLSKGLIGGVIPAIALAAYVTTTRQWQLLGRLSVTRGMILFAAITVPWFALVQMRNPEFARFFFIHEHFERFTAIGHHRPGAWWYFAPVLVFGTLPWLTLIVRALLDRARHRRPAPRGEIDVDWFLLCWAASIIVFFSLSSSKLPAYVLPALPALVLLTARRIPSPSAALVSEAAIVTLALAAALAAAAYWRTGAVQGGMDLTAALPWAAAAFAVLVGGAIAAIVAAQRARIAGALLTLALAMLATSHLALVAAHTIDELHSARHIVAILYGERGPRGDITPFYSVGEFDHSVPFYVARPVVLVGYRGEMAPGIAAEPAKYVPTIDAFCDEWRAAAAAYAIMSEARYLEFQRDGLPMRLRARDARRVIVSRD